MKTVVSEDQLDLLPRGTVLRFTVSKTRVTKVLGGLWEVENVKGVWMPCDIVRNQTPLEIIEYGE